MTALNNELNRKLATVASQTPSLLLPFWIWWVALALMLVTLMVPILAVEVPPISDYPNHLARSYFLAFGSHDSVMSRMFAVRWALIPNLAIDLLLPPLMHVLPPLMAGRAIVALTLLLPVTGAVALSVACFRRLSFWQLGAGFVGYNLMFLLGTINFQLAVGVALWGAVAWITLSPRHPMAAVFLCAPLALLCWVFHLFGYGFFAVLIGSADLAQILHRGLSTGQAWRFAFYRSAAVLAVLVVPGLLYFASPLAPASGPVVWQSARGKLFFLLAPMLAYSRIASLGVAAGLAGTVVLWLVRRQLRVAPFACVAVPLLLGLYFVLPLRAKGGCFIDTRIPVMLGFMLFATILPTRLTRREALAATAFISLLFAARIAYITHVWKRSGQEVTEVRQALAAVSPGSRVLVVDGDPMEHEWDEGLKPSWRIPEHWTARAYWHLGAFAFIDHRAFWSNAFAIAGQQPMVTLPPYSASSDAGLSPPPGYAKLSRSVGPATMTEPKDFIAGWPEKFEYVLVLGADIPSRIDNLLPEHLVLVSDKGIAALFRVITTAPR